MFNFDYLKNRGDANQVRHAGKTVGNSNKTAEEKRSLPSLEINPTTLDILICKRKGNVWQK